MKLIKTKSDLREAITKDRLRYNYSYKRYIIGLIRKRDTSHALRLLYYLRKCEYTYNNRSSSLFMKLSYMYYSFRYTRLEFYYDTHIAMNVVGPGLWIPHMGGIIINCKSMGDNCSVNKGTVIGNKAGQDNRAEIGNNCYFLLGCKVIGEVKIGSNVVVCQNSVVVKDVDNNTIVSGIPAKPIKQFDNINSLNL